MHDINPKSQRDLVQYSLLVALTRFIPLPLVDDAVRLSLLRKLARAVGSEHGRSLSDDEVRKLTDDPPSGCLGGCLPKIFMWPVKKVLPKVLVVVEMKKLSDLATLTYVQGFLLDQMFEENVWPGAERARQAIDAATQQAGTSPVEVAFSAVFESAGKSVRAVGNDLSKRVREVVHGPDEENLQRAVDATTEVGVEDPSLLDALQGAVNRVPRAYFDNLKRLLKANLADVNAAKAPG